MLFSKFAGLFILFFTIIVVACPIPEEAIESDGLEARSPLGPLRKGQSRPPFQKPTYDRTCNKLAACKCPAKQSTSCINGVCKCNNSAVNFMANMFMKGVIAIGNSTITKAIGNLMSGLSDLKEVLPTILGAFLGPEAKAALKVAIMAFPDTGPSHIDVATKNALKGVL